MSLQPRKYANCKIQGALNGIVFISFNAPLICVVHSYLLIPNAVVDFAMKAGNQP
jgi:hypothetical protein